MIAHLDRELHCSDAIGIFPDDGAIILVVGALVLSTNDACSVARRYVRLETTAPVADSLTVRLSAVAA